MKTFQKIIIMMFFLSFNVSAENDKTEKNYKTIENYFHTKKITYCDKYLRKFLWGNGMLIVEDYVLQSTHVINPYIVVTLDRHHEFFSDRLMVSQFGSICILEFTSSHLFNEPCKAVLHQKSYQNMMKKNKWKKIKNLTSFKYLQGFFFKDQDGAINKKLIRDVWSKDGLKCLIENRKYYDAPLDK